MMWMSYWFSCVGHIGSHDLGCHLGAHDAGCHLGSHDLGFHLGAHDAGCQTRSFFVGALAYANDHVLTAPTHVVIRVSDDYTVEYNVLFNPAKLNTCATPIHTYLLLLSFVILNIIISGYQVC